DGNFYGTTLEGGGAGYGTVFKITPQGTVTILHSFGDGSVPNDGIIPNGLIQGSDGNFYGTTLLGPVAGIGNYGTVFKMTPQGVVTILHSFNYDGTVSNDGIYPEAALIQGSDGNFYGTTLEGGGAGYGTVFKITPQGTVTILHSFGDGSVPNDGANPSAALIQGLDGNFYGTTTGGGAAGRGIYNSGTVFKMTPQGVVTILHNFGDGSVPNDGQLPNAALIQASDGNFYGTTLLGPVAGIGNYGTVFKMTPQGVVTILHSFGDGSVPNDGEWPQAALIQGSDGNLYGTTRLGGTAGDGTIFELSLPSSAPVITSSNSATFAMGESDSFTVIAPGIPPSTFSATGLPAGTSINPTTGVISGIPTQAGNYSVTITASNGVSPDATQSLSITVVEAPPTITSSNSATFTIGQASSFTVTAMGIPPPTFNATGLPAEVSINPTTGVISGFPTQTGTYSVTITASNGVTPNATQNFTITVAPNLVQQYVILHNFDDGSVPNDGQNPYANVIQGSDGNFYGTTYEGGAANDGTIFKITPQGTVTILHNFGDGSVPNDGGEPIASLVQGSDGNFYGTTYGGGASGDGTVFKMTPQGAMTILHSFGDGTIPNDGAYTYAALIQASDGNFYGTTIGGGTAGGGTVFEITAQGVLMILHNFGDGSIPNDGQNPYGGLIQGSDGNFYGTTEQGGMEGTANDGTIFKMTPQGTVTILHNFGDGSVPNDGNGPGPGAVLIQALDGNFYGTTTGGGAANDGTVFKMTPQGTVTILHNFGDGSVPNDGVWPYAGVIQGSDGNFYGTTYEGGTANEGAIFEITPQDTVTILHNFGDGSVSNDGVWPSAAVIEGSDGNLYGAASSGGSANFGIVFELSLPSSAPVITSSNSATFTIGQSSSFTVTAQGIPASTYSATGLPSWASLDTNSGILSGTPPDTSGAPFSITITASNGVSPDATQSFTLNVQSAFTQWAGLYFTPQQLANPAISGPGATPENDGTPNLLKYIFDIDPAVPMNAADLAALPAVGMSTIGGVHYLTLTYRENPAATGITVNVQTCADLQSWSTVTPAISQQIGTDSNTGDPIIEVGVPATGAEEFIRLNVTGS
ncbi:MAG TPA: choice-of-anchor tandem repeat GloVer-containing protein, partial [Candidatus Methylacidiphilales bacterium]|nr:choice-of-anchor tandem repeat GloVer-containing protein [Candidatus Methylacidiphilales bacterium]